MQSPTIILLPGLWQSSQFWHSFPDILSRRIPHAKLETPDLPGFGTRVLETAFVSMDEYIEDLRSQNWFRESGGPCLLIGQSIGAMIALKWQHAFPDDVLGCVLINISDRSYTWPFDRINWKAMGPLFFHWGLPSSMLSKEQIRLKYTSNLENFRASIIHQRVTWNLNHPPKTTNIWRQASATIFFNSKNIKGLRPILYINSLNDHWMSPECSDQIASRIPGKRLYHASAGHDLALDEPAWLALMIDRWLSQTLGKAE